MKIVFDNNIERRAWDLLLEAHRKWFKNHGDELVDMLQFAGKVFQEDGAVVDLACDMVTYPEKLEAENGEAYEELFTKREAEALLGRKLKAVRTGDAAQVVGYNNDGCLIVGYDGSGDCDYVSKSDYRELFVEVDEV